MQKNTIIIGIITVVLLATGTIVFFQQCCGNERADTNDLSEERVATDDLFAPEVEKILERNSVLVRELVNEMIIVNEVRKANEQHKNITQKEISTLDARWQGADDESDNFVEPFLINTTAIRLLEFQEQYPGFSEIFITDVYGLNIGQTNKTTDYYQADEAWWIATYNKGNGKIFHGLIEFDESARAEAISLYIPIVDPDTKQIIGIAKAVLNIAAIKFEL